MPALCFVRVADGMRIAQRFSAGIGINDIFFAALAGVEPTRFARHKSQPEGILLFLWERIEVRCEACALKPSHPNPLSPREKGIDALYERRILDARAPSEGGASHWDGALDFFHLCRAT